jgi:hypothetical protein
MYFCYVIVFLLCYIFMLCYLFMLCYVFMFCYVFMYLCVKLNKTFFFINHYTENRVKNKIKYININNINIK